MREKISAYICKMYVADIFSSEDILDLVRRKFKKSISRATLYRIINENKND